MRRRDFIHDFGRSAAVMAVLHPDLLRSSPSSEKRIDPKTASKAIANLSGENPAEAQVRVERGGPRLFLNGREIYPFFALSTDMIPTIQNYRKAGIHIYHPILGMQSCWTGPDRYGWARIDEFLGSLLALNPSAYFLPRLQLDTPIWWKEANPDELIQYGLPTPQERYNVIEKRNLEESECGYYFHASGDELWEASFASLKWRKDTSAMLSDFLKHIESSPLSSRMIGYMPTTGWTAEWNSWGEDFLPDTSAAMRMICGAIPEVHERLNTTFGLLRDPQKERKVIDFYLKYHDTIADTVLSMCSTVKESTNGRVLAGVFYGYVLEQVRIQEGGYLSMKKILESPYVDYIAGPYSYMPGNVTNSQGIRVTTQDGSGNLLGSARGVAGDGGYRLMTESLRRHGKLYFSEMDPSTYLEKDPHRVFGGHGGEGCDTEKGTLMILRRDLGRMFASGSGGWLFDFGPLNQTKTGWYSSPSIIREIKRFVRLGQKRPGLDIGPMAEIAVLCDDRAFAATEHWLAPKPWADYAIKATDFFNHWFLNSQARALHRIGTPVDFLHPRDLLPEDRARYKLIIMANLFRLEDRDAERLLDFLHGSGSTAVWIYAPGFIASDRLDLTRMERLTGFHFNLIREPGPMSIRTTGRTLSLPSGFKFGPATSVWPRFDVADPDAEIMGIWDELGTPALARKKTEGYWSVYSGAAPMPASLLREICKMAGVRLWSTEEDIMAATRDSAMLTASSDGMRTLTLPCPMAPAEGGESKTVHEIKMERGETRIFLA